MRQPVVQPDRLPIAMQKLRELEKKLGTGQTLSPREITLALKHGIPAWLIVAGKVGSTGLQKRCEVMIESLQALHEACRPALASVGLEGAKEDG